MNYVIVKNASAEFDPPLWNMYFDSNPQEGVHPSYSCHDTYTGQVCDIKPSYVTRQSAEEDLKKVLAENPSGYYAVCPVAV